MVTTRPRPLRDSLPTVIQGGMGVAVSSWALASSVARRGQMGVVSGTALDLVLTRRLQDGDPDGACRRALAAFPAPAIATRVIDRYLLPDGREPGAPYAPVPRLGIRQSRALQELLVVASFVEVWLAKEGHDGPVGINFLEKIQMATPAAAYGAMLAGVDAVLMGAGIPRHIPRMLDHLAEHQRVRLPIDVAGDPGGGHAVELDPSDLLGTGLASVDRPMFLAIVSSEALAGYLCRDPEIRPDGFVVEGPAAGGHNAPPRGRPVQDERGQPVFGPRDHADVAKIAALGLPFWLAGAYGSPDGVASALAGGAAGVQVGTEFALSAESGIPAPLKASLLRGIGSGTLEVLTDAHASPTGFPFKVVQLPETLSGGEARASRSRICDLGYLRTPFAKGDGRVGYRCPAEPEGLWRRKGGDAAESAGRVCLCNALAATVGLGQARPGGEEEKPIVTLGTDTRGARALVHRHPAGWTASDVIDWLLEGTA